MNEERYQLFDNMATVALANLYSVMRKQDLILDELNPTKERHKLFLIFLNFIDPINEFTIKISLRQWLKLDRENKKRFGIKIFARTNFSIEEFLYHISQAYDERIEIWDEIYNTYYSGKEMKIHEPRKIL